MEGWKDEWMPCKVQWMDEIMLSVGVLTTLVLEKRFRQFSAYRQTEVRKRCQSFGYRVPESLEKDARLDICDFEFSRFDFAKAKPTRRSKHHIWNLHKLKQFAL